MNGRPLDGFECHVVWHVNDSDLNEKSAASASLEAGRAPAEIVSGSGASSAEAVMVAVPWS